mmetsp:Transcript_146684/g.470693  ORF Transcript_146684/g.470693 Transcript_146684/m.470693 type:complete len:91 (+) Transcript_146684:124-396(+)
MHGQLDLVCCCRTEPSAGPYCHADEIRLLLGEVFLPLGQPSPLLQSISVEVRQLVAQATPLARSSSSADLANPSAEKRTFRMMSTQSRAR